MVTKKILILGILAVLVVVGLATGLSKKVLPPKNSGTTGPSTSQPTSTNQPETSGQIAASIPKSDLEEPVADFRVRVTKKPFGIYITPQNSPISPERFTGYHTGTDAEYQDITVNVPVYAVADGVVVLSRTASGYGGVFMIEISLNEEKHTILYGHIRPSSLPKVGLKVAKGEQIALLGTGYNSETDGERRHLHFAVLADNSQNIKGYVPLKNQLSSWIDPLNYY